MGASDDARRRRIHQDDATRQITGVDPNASRSEDALAAQRFQFTNFVRQCYDAGYDPMTLIECLLAGAAFIGDNHGVGRPQMASFITQVNMGQERSLIWTPK